MNYFKNPFHCVVVAGFCFVLFMRCNSGTEKQTLAEPKKDSLIAVADWVAPDTNTLPSDEQGALIKYGRQLIANTSYYLGPKGTVAHLSNGMNCQNCHIDAGAKPYGNCFSAVAATYPTFRPRSGKVESIEFRINDCIMRSLNGKPMDSLSREMRAMVAYLKWIGKDVPKGSKPKGAGTEELTYLDRPADPGKGKMIFLAKCKVCHQENGGGVKNADSATYQYPPLWGPHSYNTGAGMYRLTKFAGFVKNSMPFGASHNQPQLTNEEAWDVAAFVNSQSRPRKDFPKDWPKLDTKAVDFPFGPYSDTFSEKQHKYGPFGPIKKAKDDAKKPAK